MPTMGSAFCSCASVYAFASSFTVLTALAVAAKLVLVLDVLLLN
jgi:hypothetical protein